MLNVAELSIRTGLVGLVHTPTRGASILDMLMISDPDTYFVKVAPPSANRPQGYTSHNYWRHTRQGKNICYQNFPEKVPKSTRTHASRPGQLRYIAPYQYRNPSTGMVRVLPGDVRIARQILFN